MLWRHWLLRVAVPDEVCDQGMLFLSVSWIGLRHIRRQLPCNNPNRANILPHSAAPLGISRFPRSWTVSALTSGADRPGQRAGKRIRHPDAYGHTFGRTVASARTRYPRCASETDRPKPVRINYPEQEFREFDKTKHRIATDRQSIENWPTNYDMVYYKLNIMAFHQCSYGGAFIWICDM